MSHVEQMMRIVKYMYGREQDDRDITLYEGKNSILRIRNSVTRTRIEEFIVDEGTETLIMRLRMGLHSLRKYRAMCRSYVDNVTWLLFKEGRHVDLKMENNGEVYFQCVESIKERALSLCEVERMYADISLAEGRFGLELQMVTVGMNPWQAKCKEIMDDEQELVLGEIDLILQK